MRKLARVEMARASQSQSIVLRFPQTKLKTDSNIAQSNRQIKRAELSKKKSQRYLKISSVEQWSSHLSRAHRDGISELPRFQQIS